MTLPELQRRIRALKNLQSREAVSLLLQAAAFDDASALSDLGMLYRDGVVDSRGKAILRPDQARSVKCFRRAAELGNSSAMVDVGHSLRGRAGLRWYRRAFRFGDSRAASSIAVTYQDLGRPADAVRWFRRAVATGETACLLELAQAELFGIGTKRNVPAAIRKLQTLAKGGWISQLSQETAMRWLAEIYSQGWLVCRNWKLARRWLAKASKLGSAAASGLLQDLGER